MSLLSERSLFAGAGDGGSEGVNTPSRDFQSPVPYGKQTITSSHPSMSMLSSEY